MTWTLRDKEMESVLDLPGPQRYAYWVKKVADEEIVWSLAEGEGWALVGDGAGGEAIPVWPHERYAAECAGSLFAGYTPRSIPLEKWLEVWIPGMAKDGRSVAVFPNRAGQGPVVSAERLEDDLRSELSQYE